MKSKKSIYWIVAILGWCIGNSCNKGSSPTPNTTTYFPKVKAIVSDNCLSCHSSKGSWTGRPTAFDSDSAIAANANIIKTAIAGPWSFFVKQMPQGSTLSASDITTIETWVSKGGKTTN